MNSSADKILTSVMQEVSLHFKKVKKKEKKENNNPPQNKQTTKKTKQLLKYQDVKPALISTYKAKP